MMAVTDAGQPFTTRELYQDALDEAEETWERLYEDAPFEEKLAEVRRQQAQYGRESKRVDRIFDWPNEPSDWS